MAAAQHARKLGSKNENWNEIGPGMGFEIGFGWLFGLLIPVPMVFAIAALIFGND